MSLKPVSFSKPLEHLPRLSKPYVPGKQDARFWTDTELTVIRTYYVSGGAGACMAHLPAHRTISGVYQQAKKLGLSGDPNKPRNSYKSTPELDERIREEWVKLDGRKRGEVEDLAARLSVPRWWLTKRATKLGLTIAHKKEPPWTAVEDALMRRVPLHDPDKCSDIFREHGFKRSPTAIVVRAKRLDLSRRATREELSATRAAKILGVDGKWVTGRILAGELRATKRDDKRLPQQGGQSWDIRPEDLRRYVIDHLEQVDLRKVDKFEFVALIAGEGA
ncbi:hypothetical protein [Sinorhizobium americanum]|uniref:Uncharacterized protein n=1 Tax=Sinorhizobium americanum TaxID=194963 RepID=A0A4R2BRI6_9HYPH|nr:hypothetical protein [Sinorhizobium americanum]TCN30318.1 hypothetical protein EV184_108192 [Sinorhizobium americanum]